MSPAPGHAHAAIPAIRNVVLRNRFRRRNRLHHELPASAAGDASRLNGSAAVAAERWSSLEARLPGHSIQHPEKKKSNTDSIRGNNLPLNPPSTRGLDDTSLLPIPTAHPYHNPWMPCQMPVDAFCFPQETKRQAGIAANVRDWQGKHVLQPATLVKSGMIEAPDSKCDWVGRPANLPFPPRRGGTNG